ncbi:pre-mRNA 3'-end-processing factor FIP1 isoform X6 [Alligator mississippiensis]|uniref:pre-mRNA 3'-end-processing factor FIP1 isoform X6 n=1 Tax=Alligator mississippiensis TaxID=8496 RepID=UPI002877255F|nr:pre-mRNA 3'-end-processing factor FIP1 isoform X6 [Alligator mississippiensis]
MSAGEVERLPAELSGSGGGSGGSGGGDEEEEWLYGDENEVERPEEEKASAPTPSGKEEETAENGVVKKKVTVAEDDSDSDSDDDEDDVQVTIGDIKTGAPQYSYGTAPVNLNIKTGGRVYGSSGGKVKGVDLDAPGSINGVPLLEVDLDSFEDKPWRKPGADLSDYFNYGFNEDTWKAYCEKQKRIRMGLEILPLTSASNKIMVQQGRTGNMEKDVILQPIKADFTSPPPLFKSGIPNRNSASSQAQTSTASRKASAGIRKWQERYGRAGSPDIRRLSGTIDVIGQTITISRVEGRRRANENSNIQVLSERSNAEVDNFTKPPPFFPPGAPPTHLPPPPFLPPPPTVSTAPPLIPPPGIPITVPPPGFPPPPGGPPPSLIPTIESGHSSGYDGRSARAFPYGNVTFPHLAGSAPSWPSLVETSKQWDYYARREKERERERDRERDRDRDRDRDRERDRTRERERDRDHSPTPSVFNSDEERYRYRDYAERGYERHRTSREKEERHRERRHREKEETRHKSSRSNSRRRHDSEEGDSHRRHKHKKSKRSKEGKETGSEPAPEQENTEAAPAE